MRKVVGHEAWEMHAQGRLERARFALEGDEASGWIVRRNGIAALDVPAGHRLLDVVACGVCATDLARPFLPFPLPQVVGHEVVARDAADRRWVIEINDSHAARGEPSTCAFCASGLERHCPERMVLGIDRLPGGFGAHVLAPVNALVAVPDALPTRTAVLVEPFAAALNAVESSRPRAGETVAVLGPRRLGALLVAALASWRRREGVAFRLEAWVRRDGLEDLLLGLGADVVLRAPAPGEAGPRADVVFDTTGNPDALPVALAAARREVHLKSTHGRPSGGVARGTEIVVDELVLEGDPGVLAGAGLAGAAPVIAWLARGEPRVPAGARVVRGDDPRALLARLEAGEGGHPLGRADVAVIDDESRIDAIVRPDPAREIALVRPRGTILLQGGERPPVTPVGRALAGGLRLAGTRCGPFEPALRLLAEDPDLRELGALFVSHVFTREELPLALETAAGPACIKAVVGEV